MFNGIYIYLHLFLIHGEFKEHCRSGVYFILDIFFLFLRIESLENLSVTQFTHMSDIRVEIYFFRQQL